MSANAEIARLLDETAAMMEVLGENRFRVAALQRASRVISGLGVDLAQIAQDREALLAIDGVGDKIADKIQEYVRTGRIAERDEYAQRIPSGVLDLLGVPGLGPKTVGLLWREKNITTLAGLKRALEDGSILDLPRMGKRSAERIARALAFTESSGSRTPIGVAMPIAESIVVRLEASARGATAVYAGSLRRGRDTVGDVDILACATDADAVSRAFREAPEVAEVLAAGATKSSVRLRAGDTGRLIQADLRVVERRALGAAMLYFTGSKDHNVALRERARARGLTLNEYGLFPDDGGPTPPQVRGVTPVAAKTEAAIYSKLGLAHIPPELREDRGEIAAAEAGALPDLIEPDHISAELHAHTTASDGSLSIEALAREAQRRGFHTVAVTDHSKSQTVANGLDEARLREHIASIRAVNERMRGVTVLAGAEVDIHADGSLDYDDDTLALLDIVVASPHWALTQKPADATRRLLRAIEHPLVDIVGHPTGRLIGKREGLSPDIAELCAAAAEHGTALEINAHWMRLDLRDTHVRAAVEAGAPIAINCDVHSERDFDNLRYGVMTARRGWLPADRCVNAWSARRLRAWLGRRR